MRRGSRSPRLRLFTASAGGHARPAAAGSASCAIDAGASWPLLLTVPSGVVIFFQMSQHFVQMRPITESEIAELHSQAFRDLEGGISDCIHMSGIAAQLMSNARVGEEGHALGFAVLRSAVGNSRRLLMLRPLRLGLGRRLRTPAGCETLPPPGRARAQGEEIALLQRCWPWHSLLCARLCPSVRLPGRRSSMRIDQASASARSASRTACLARSRARSARIFAPRIWLPKITSRDLVLMAGHFSGPCLAPQCH